MSLVIICNVIIQQYESNIHCITEQWIEQYIKTLNSLLNKKRNILKIKKIKDEAKKLNN